MYKETVKNTGWKEAERELLFGEAKIAQENNAPLKQVFNHVAALTGRKPNSIRNYYYLCAKENGINNTASFKPFVSDEIYSLVREILICAARGESVRACSYRLGDSTKQGMLRIQNKYRSVIKSSPQIVMSVIAELEKESVKYFNPYTDKTRRGRKKSNVRAAQMEEIADTLNNLNMLNIDAEAFFHSLNTLSRLALNNGGGVSESLMQDTLVSTQLELKNAKTKLSQVSSMFNQLLNMNREFLDTSGTSASYSL